MKSGAGHVIGLGTLSHDDPLYGYLQSHIIPQLGHSPECGSSFSVSRFPHSSNVYLYEEREKGLRFVGKFFKSSDRDRSRRAAENEFNNLLFLRGLGFSGAPHYIVRAFGFNPAIDNLVVTEYIKAETMDGIVNQAVYRGGHRRLYKKLSALAWFLATLHNKTAGSDHVDFDESCQHMGRLLRSLSKRYKEIIFDVYGTLIDIETDEGDEEIYRAISHFLTYRGIYMNRWEVKDSYFRIVKDLRKAGREKYPEFNAVELWTEFLRQHAGRDVPSNQLRGLPVFLTEMYRSIARRRLQLYPGVKDLLNELRLNYKTAAISDAQVKGGPRNLSESGYGRPNAMKDYLYLRISQKEPLDILYFTPSLTWIFNIDDQSFSLSPEVVYTGITNLELRLKGAVLAGGHYTE
ncbi:MAG: HAD family hydrolase, partial [Thermodesulfobacteriota bacterium]